MLCNIKKLQIFLSWHTESAHNLAYICKRWFDFNFIVLHLSSKFVTSQHVFSHTHTELEQMWLGLASMQQIVGSVLLANNAGCKYKWLCKNL